MPLWYGYNLCITGPLWGEFTGNEWPLRRANTVEMWRLFHISLKSRSIIFYVDHTKCCKFYIYGDVSNWCTLYLLPTEQRMWLNIYVKVWTKCFRWSRDTRIAHGRILHTHMHDKFCHPICLLQRHICYKLIAFSVTKLISAMIDKIL